MIPYQDRKRVESHCRLLFADYCRSLGLHNRFLPDRLNEVDANTNGFRVELKNWRQDWKVRDEDFLAEWLPRRIDLVIATDHCILPKWNKIPVLKLNWFSNFDRRNLSILKRFFLGSPPRKGRAGKDDGEHDPKPADVLNSEGGIQFDFFADWFELSIKTTSPTDCCSSE